MKNATKQKEMKKEKRARGEVKRKKIIGLTNLRRVEEIIRIVNEKAKIERC